MVDTSRKLVGVDGSEWFPRFGKKQNEVCYWSLESKRVDGACHKCKGMKLACGVEEESQSEVPTKKAQTVKAKGKDQAALMADDTQIPGLVDFSSWIAESLQQLVEKVCQTNALLFNLRTNVTKNTKPVWSVENLLYKICRSQSLMGELPGDLEGET